MPTRNMAQPHAQSDTLIPVTIVTGFLGSGKTTLLNHILRSAHGRRIAVIENEFGEAGIDNEILVGAESAEIVEMANGCICCTIRGDLSRILRDLAGRMDAGELEFERVVIETTGVADPGPVAQTFFVDEDVASRYRIDGIVTLIDAKHGQRNLDENAVARRQVGFADRLVLTKSDLVDDTVAAALVDRLHRMNARAPVKRVEHGRAALEDVLDLGGFELDDALGIDPAFLAAEAAGDRHQHAHESDVHSFVWRGARALDLEKLERYVGLLIERFGDDMLRYKGLLDVSGRDQRIVIQGVQRLVGSEPGRRWSAGETRASVLVFIGRNLPQALIASGLELCAAGADEDPARVLRAAA